MSEICHIFVTRFEKNVTKMIIKRQIAFKLRPYGKDMNLFQIQMHTTFNSQRIITSTGCQINSLDVWNAKDEIVTDGYQGLKGATSLSINNELRKLRDQMETAFKYFEANDIFPTRDQIVKKYEERVKGVTPKKPEPEKKKETKPKEPDLWRKECLDQSHVPENVSAQKRPFHIQEETQVLRPHGKDLD